MCVGTHTRCYTSFGKVEVMQIYYSIASNSEGGWIRGETKQFLDLMWAPQQQQ